MSRRSEGSALSAGVAASVSLSGTGAGAFGQRELKLPLIAAETPVEFRALLGEIRKAAGGMSFGQIAAKTRMARSTAFALTDTKRLGLPTRDLVILYVTACGLSKQQVGEVAELWDELDAKPVKTVEESLAKPLPVEVEAEIVPMRTAPAPLVPVRRRTPRRGTTAEVVLRALRSDRENRRALRLLWPLAFVASVLIAGLTVIAVIVPGAAQALGTFFAVTTAVGIVIGLMVARVRFDRQLAERRGEAAGASRPPGA
ncbi:hypothetical protein ACWEF6_21155 [Amycolatopsis sp. NPDC004772]